MNATGRAPALARIDLSDATVVAAYERAFYDGFAAASHNRLIHWLWEWDHDARRLRTRLGYERQAVYVMPGPDGAIDAAIAVNLAPPPLQAAAFGFVLPADVAPGTACEFLTFFAHREHGLHRKLTLWREVFAALRTEGFARGFATTAAKILPLYGYMGARRIGESALEGEARFFLEFDLATGPGLRGRERRRERAAADDSV